MDYTLKMKNTDGSTSSFANVGFNMFINTKMFKKAAIFDPSSPYTVQNQN